MKQYKVLSQKDSLVMGKFDPDKLERTLNALARQGWTVKAAVSSDMIGVIPGSRDQVIVILERDRQDADPTPKQAVTDSPARREAEQKLQELGMAFATEDLAAKQGDQSAAARRDAIAEEKQRLIDAVTLDGTLTDREAEEVFAEMAFPLGRQLS